MNTDKNYLLASVVVGLLDENTYLIANAATREAFIIDPGDEPQRIDEAIAANGFKPAGIVITHGHVDHIGGTRYLKEKYGVPLYIHKADATWLANATKNGSVHFGRPVTSPEADVLLEEGSKIRLGGLTFTVYHTPGHTPGCICLHVDDLLFTGDTLFAGTIGRTDLPGGDDDEMMASLRKFRQFPLETVILPGHGPSSTLADEFVHNPYLKD